MLFNLASITELIRLSLQNKVDTYFSWLLGFTVAVAIGILMEIAEAVIITDRLSRRESRTGRVRFKLRQRLKTIEKWGARLVLIGVAGELVAEYLGSAADTNLRKFNNTFIVGLQRQVADARTRASNAEETAKGFDSKIAEARRGTVEAQRDAADANALAQKYASEIHASDARAKRAEAQVAGAKAQAEEARSMAEAERLERVRLEAAVAPRSLSLEQQRHIAAACTPFIGHRVLVSSYGLDGEGAAIGAQIITLLQSVLGNDNVLDSRASSIISGGFQLGIHLRGPDSELDFIRVLSDELTSIGHLQTFVNQPVPRLGAAIMGGGGSFPAGTVFVDIMVGIKPVPMLPSR
jgi:hypothetical protein